MGNHCGTKICYNLASQYDLGFYLRISEIQITVFQSCIFICFFRTVNLERKLLILAFAQYLNGFGNYFNIPGCQLRVLRAALSHGSCYFNGRLCIDCRKLLHQIFCFNDDLCRSIKISQDNKSEVFAHLTDVLKPSDQSYFFSCVFQSELAAVVCSSLHLYSHISFCDISPYVMNYTTLQTGTSICGVGNSRAIL